MSFPLNSLGQQCAGFLCLHNAEGNYKDVPPMDLALQIHTISLGAMPKEHVFVHIAIVCTINSYFLEVYFGVQVPIMVD